ncbi:MAG: IS110 family transposase [Nitrospirota bacterium]
MKLYTAFDLHSSNSYLAVIDGDGKRVYKRKLKNDPKVILSVLSPYRDNITGIAVESTYNWYWLGDLLMAEGYKVHLANPSAIQKYKGLKYSDDEHDTFWLAEMLRLGVLPEGYIYPKEQRPIRDLLRKRGHLVRLRTSLLLSLQNIITRNNGIKPSVNDLKALGEDRSAAFFQSSKDLALAGRVSKDCIDYLSRQIREVEKYVEKTMKLRTPYTKLLSIPGVGKILGLTIMLETGPIERFEKAGNYVSYCRKVSSKWVSNEKKKGKGNKKCGNKYLSWAYSEAAEAARRLYAEPRAYYNRKKQKTTAMSAYNALAHKLAKAAFYIMRDGVTFKSEKTFV